MTLLVVGGHGSEPRAHLEHAVTKIATTEFGDPGQVVRRILVAHVEVGVVVSFVID